VIRRWIARRRFKAYIRERLAAALHVETSMATLGNPTKEPELRGVSESPGIVPRCAGRVGTRHEPRAMDRWPYSWICGTCGETVDA